MLQIFNLLGHSEELLFLSLFSVFYLCLKTSCQDIYILVLLFSESVLVKFMHIIKKTNLISLESQLYFKNTSTKMIIVQIKLLIS